jgi:hypothetical protein
MAKLIRKINSYPENIYNMKEMGFMLGQTLKVTVICCRGRRNFRYSQDGNQEKYVQLLSVLL